MLPFYAAVFKRVHSKLVLILNINQQYTNVVIQCNKFESAGFCAGFVLENLQRTR